VAIKETSKTKKISDTSSQKAEIKLKSKSVPVRKLSATLSVKDPAKEPRKDIPKPTPAPATVVRPAPTPKVIVQKEPPPVLPDPPSRPINFKCHACCNAWVSVVRVENCPNCNSKNLRIG
jgi:hypothetical protein